MNRRKSVVLGPGSSFPMEKKGRSGFGFRRGDSSNAHAQLPSTPPGRDSRSIASDSIASPPPTRSTTNDYPPSEDVITPIPESNDTSAATAATAATNGLTPHHKEVALPSAAGNQV